MLGFEVEFLSGVSVAATPYRRDDTEWPPHPDRLFQALTAAWGRADVPDAAERRALEWLEGLEAAGPEISAPAASRRDAATVFVPPNDARTTGSAGDEPPKDLAAALRVIPEWRKNRQPREFPAMVSPLEPPFVVRYSWHLDAEQKRAFAEHRTALERLTREATYLGHPHSVVRIALTENVASESALDWMGPSDVDVELRIPYKGRLAELNNCYQRAIAENRVIRPGPSRVLRTYKRPTLMCPSSSFDDYRTIVFAGIGGFVPTLASFPLVAKRLRDALLACAPKDEPISYFISGHGKNGEPTTEPHIAIVPLAYVGWPHSRGELLGLALVWPRDADEGHRRSVLKAIANFIKQEEGKAGVLHFGRNGSWRLALEPEPLLASRDFARYSKPAKKWGTVLPVALDRHPKNKNGAGLADIVARACMNIGLPKESIDGIEIEVHKHPTITGSPSVREVLESLPQDSPYCTKPLAHLVITFPNPVRGPILLGAGRFRGLGMCLSVD